MDLFNALSSVVNMAAMDLLPAFLLATLLALIILYLISQHYQNKSYFESKGVFYGGNGLLGFAWALLLRKNQMQEIKRNYLKFKGQGIKLVGMKDYGNITTLVVHDPEILKSIMVKDFDHFVDRTELKFSENDEIFERMLFDRKGEPWKALRSKLSPTFTTGKNRRLTKLMDQSAKRMVSFIAKETKIHSEIELEAIYSKFTMDVIASVVCGYDSKAFDQKGPSLFEQMGKRMKFEYGRQKAIEMFMTLVSTRLVNLLGFAVIDKEVTDFFSMAIKSAIKERRETGVKKDDFLQLLLEARDGKLPKLGEDEIPEEYEKAAELKGSSHLRDEVLDEDIIVANCAMFFLGGLETIQSLLLFCSYALALNQDIQDRLREEIDKVLEDSGGELTYDGMNSMGYLDMVLQETLRCYPPAPMVNRGCTQDYKVPGTDLTLKKGDAVVIPIDGLHHDPEFFPEPEKFDPERFSPENKPNINQYAFLPFGQGPRNCIGMRFALVEAKVAIIHLVHTFKIEPSKRTLIPMEFANATTLKPKGGMFLSLTKIQ